MRQRLLRGYIPACAVCRGFSVDDNVSVLVGELAVFCGTEKLVCVPCTCVEDKDDGRLRLKLLRNVDVHLNSGGIGTEVLDLREGSALDELVVRLDCCTLHGAESH
jgi:hypothetical protein